MPRAYYTARARTPSRDRLGIQKHNLLNCGRILAPNAPRARELAWARSVIWARHTAASLARGTCRLVCTLGVGYHAPAQARRHVRPIHALTKPSATSNHQLSDPALILPWPPRTHPAPPPPLPGAAEAERAAFFRRRLPVTMPRSHRTARDESSPDHARIRAHTYTHAHAHTHSPPPARCSRA